ncbi:MAG: YqgE/AlgH family protein [Rhodomicrobiaceae bacterium]
MPRSEPNPKIAADTGYLDGHLLLAMPSMTDPRFQRAVIYMCAHSADGAMGIVVNQRASHITFPKLLEQLGIVTTPEPESIRIPLEKMPVHTGGPVETGRGFVLHTCDYYSADSTLPIDDSVSLTATLDILRAIAAGSGPTRSLLALGYAGWAPGQLEREIQANGWLICPADNEIVFDAALDTKYDRAMAKLGIHPSFLVSEAGHA